MDKDVTTCSDEFPRGAVYHAMVPGDRRKGFFGMTETGPSFLGYLAEGAAIRAGTRDAGNAKRIKQH
jgi:hypothetical protein